MLQIAGAAIGERKSYARAENRAAGSVGHLPAESLALLFSD